MREEAHQSHGAEVDRLRQRVAVLEPLAQQAQASQEAAQALRQQFQAAVGRAVQFEKRLLALQRSAGQGSEIATPALR
jgi:predicted  nucleic acid-binding Zn-ribbon protein